ncbi:hypothetical protein [Photorhabdus aegyptia]|uniref:Uncharacterized protein n=1 Tax=Photorhabdus aegyptia TaxID=2805098 RepID=A0A022PHB0_9GAMM|nr:hypothetical protein [Photorhabdus aegyptia]EYU13890.1 hypothetical protein BA1DRAFT_03574 [Photorhabdus aegyptia]
MFGLIALDLIVLFMLVTLYKCVLIVPQSDQWIIERLGKSHTVLSLGAEYSNPVSRCGGL